MATPPPDSAVDRLRAYVRATHRHRAVRGAVSPASLADLAERTGLDRGAFRRALDALIEADEVEVLVHQGGILELRPRERARRI